MLVYLGLALLALYVSSLQLIDFALDSFFFRAPRKMLDKCYRKMQRARVLLYRAAQATPHGYGLCMGHKS